MMRHAAITACAAIVAVSVSGARAQDMTTLRSASDFAATKSRLVESARAKGFAIVAEVDHAAAAKASGLELQPTHLVIFGNPRGGTPLMACRQTAGIDLPLKALIWQTSDGVVNVTMNSPAFVASRHGIGECAAAALANMGKALEGIASDATRP
jgi:uncharacterized protein (DUF302 family)